MPTLSLLIFGAGGLVNLTGESLGRLYPLGMPGFTWGRGTTFEKKLKIWEIEDFGKLKIWSRGFQWALGGLMMGDPGLGKYRVVR